MGRSFESLNGSIFAVIDAYGRTADEMMRDLEMKFNALPATNDFGMRKSEVGWIMSIYERVEFDGTVQDNKFRPMCPSRYSKR